MVTASEYESPLLKSTANQSSDEFSEYDIFLTLDSLKPTATGLDGLPVWYLRLVAPWIASPISYIYNLSYNSSVVPVQWKLSSICRATLLSTSWTAASLRLMLPVASGSAPHQLIVPRHRYQVRPSGVFCCRSDSLELAARLSPLSVT